MAKLLGDLRSRRLIVAKGLLFLVLAGLCAGLILRELPEWRIALLLALFAWAVSRFYYFLFYVLERYVDPELRYTGLSELVRTLLRRGKGGRADH